MICVHIHHTRTSGPFQSLRHDVDDPGAVRSVVALEQWTLPLLVASRNINKVPDDRLCAHQPLVNQQSRNVGAVCDVRGVPEAWIDLVFGHCATTWQDKVATICLGVLSLHLIFTGAYCSLSNPSTHVLSSWLASSPQVFRHHERASTLWSCTWWGPSYNPTAYHLSCCRGRYWVEIPLHRYAMKIVIATPLWTVCWHSIYHSNSPHVG